MGEGVDDEQALEKLECRTNLRMEPALLLTEERKSADCLMSSISRFFSFFDIVSAIFMSGSMNSSTQYINGFLHVITLKLMTKTRTTKK